MIVLVADDDPLARHVVSAVVRLLGYTLLEAENGLQALDYIQKEEVSLLITDWHMPGLNGPELIQWVRQSDLPRYVSCILLTVRDHQSDRIHGLDAGADDYLVKPVDPDELRARIMVANRVLTLERKLRRANDQLQALAAQLQHQVIHDPLTGLLNRQGIYERAALELSRAQRNKQPLGVALLDIDYFKRINDNYGHAAGDLALTAVAQEIRSVMRLYDIVGRWGGEEFLMLLPNADLNDTYRIAERVRQQIAESRIILPNTTKITMHVSIGITSSSDTVTTLDALVAEADQALYEAKETGRNQVCRTKVISQF